MATNKSAAIGKLIRDTKAPRSIAKPPSNSVSMLAHAVKCGAGTASACRISANASGPLDSLAKPCSMKPKPTIRRNGMGAQRAIGNRPGKSNAMSRKDSFKSALGLKNINHEITMDSHQPPFCCLLKQSISCGKKNAATSVAASIQVVTKTELSGRTPRSNLNTCRDTYRDTCRDNRRDNRSTD